MGNTSKINLSNYFDSTRANFKPFDTEKAEKLLTAFGRVAGEKKTSKVNANGRTFAEVDGEIWFADFASQSKNAYWASRANSFYFTKKGSRSIVRISDHWSASKYDRSNKLNCGSLRSCYWSNLKGERFEVMLKGERYVSALLAGVCSFSKFTKTF